MHTRFRPAGSVTTGVGAWELKGTSKTVRNATCAPTLHAHSKCSSCYRDQRLLQLLAEMQAVVKTVGNDNWRQLIDNMKMRTDFKTPTSLPPPFGSGMVLYGSPTKSPVGLIWDLNQLNPTDGYVFPSGFYAKTEGNVINGQLSPHVDPNGNAHNSLWCRMM